MQTLIILEGCDCAGKTTLGKALQQELKLPLRERIVRVGPENVIEAHMKELLLNGMILDRCYLISDIVYEPIFAKKASACLPLKLALEAVTEYKAIVVHVTASEEDVRNRFAKEGDDIYGLEQILLARSRYKSYFELSTLDYITVNTSEESIEQMVEKIKSKYEKGIK